MATSINRSREPVAFPKAPKPRDHQVELFGETAVLLKAGSRRRLAYTGWGKTVLGYHAAATFSVKTLVITTKDDIYKQWLEGAKTFLGLPDDVIGEIRGDKCEVHGTDFVVAMIHSLSKDGKYPDWITKGFGLVIFDECHRVPAEHFSDVVDMFPASCALGLSATPDRADGKELLIYAHIGPIRAKTEAQLMVPKVLRFTSTGHARACCGRPRDRRAQGGQAPASARQDDARRENARRRQRAQPHDRAALPAGAGEGPQDRRVLDADRSPEDAAPRLQHAFKISGRQMGFYVGRPPRPRRTPASARRSSRSSSPPTG